MNSIISRSIPFKDVMKDLANEFGTTFSQSCEEYTLEIPRKHGKGSVRGINFGEGIGVLLYDCMFYEDLEIQFVVNEVHPLKFLFCEKGSFRHFFESSSKHNKVVELQNIIVASDQNRGHVLRFDANIHATINSLEIDRAKFLESMSCEISDLNPVMKQLFRDVEGKEMFNYHGSYSLKMANAFSQIAAFAPQEFERNLFLHGQAYNMLSIQLLEYQDAQSSEKNRSVLLKRELSLIQEAARLIDEDILVFNTVENLSQKVGLNQNKLQNGFRELFGTTVNAYVQEKRLAIASVLIKNTEHSFTEIAYMVGITSKSYFSKIFKDRYGLTPSEIRKNTSKKIQ